MLTSVFALTAFQLFSFLRYSVIAEAHATPTEQSILCVDQLKDIRTFSTGNLLIFQFIYVFNSSEDSDDMSTLGLQKITPHLYFVAPSDAGFYYPNRTSGKVKSSRSQDSSSLLLWTTGGESVEIFDVQDLFGSNHTIERSLQALERCVKYSLATWKVVLGLRDGALHAGIWTLLNRYSVDSIVSYGKQSKTTMNVDAETVVRISVSVNKLNVKTIHTSRLLKSMKTLHDVAVLSSSSKNFTDASSPCDGGDEEEVPIWIKNGGFVVVVFGMIILFWALAEVCDNYFVASLLVLCEENKIPDNVAGATFMAIGTSFSDLMISVIALFVSNSTVGLGTIIGSELFNHLVISSACVFYSKTGLVPLNKNIFTRDAFVYALTLGMMMASLSSGSFASEEFDQCISMPWYVGFLLIVGFALYALLVVYFEMILNYIYPVPKLSIISMVASQTNPIADMSNVTSDSKFELRRFPNKEDRILSTDGDSSVDREITAGCKPSDGKIFTVSKQVNSNDIAVVDKTLNVPDLLNKFLFLFRLIFSYTIPNVKKEEWRPYYPLTIMLSIVWLGLLAQGLLTCVDIVGTLLGIDPLFVGLTIGAWGASMPTLFSSMIVSRQGLGDMAISNALGANIFSVLVGLGLPWFAYPLYIGGPYEGIRNEGILPLLVVLIACIIVHYALIAWNNYVIKSWMGYVFMLMYSLVIVLCATVFKIVN